jgi:general secretion pathway protein H
VKGFTLLELLVVLLIALSAVAVAVPLLSSTRSAVALKAKARELAFTLRSARSEAIRQHREVTVEVPGGRIGFYPDGSSSGGRVLLGAAAVSPVVEVDEVTGRVVILE